MKNLTAFDNENDPLDGSFSQQILIDEIEKLRNLSQNIVTYESISEIKISQNFSKIFSINNEILQSLQTSMQQKGFDSLHPILLWTKTHEILDGHTRFEAAKNVGLKKVPVIFVPLENEDEVKNYIYTLQFQRRNMSVSDRLHFLVNYLQENGKPPYFREWVAKMLRVSTGTATKYVRLVDSPESIEFSQVMQNHLTLNKAYERLLSQDKYLIVERKKQEKVRNQSLETHFQNIQKLPLKKRQFHLNYLESFIYSLSENKMLNKKHSQEILEFIKKSYTPM